MTEQINQTKQLSADEVNAWQRECLESGQKYLAGKGILPVTIIEKECRVLPPLCAVWKIKGNDGKTYWVMTGRLPTDAVEVSAAQTAREVMKHFSYQWQLKANTIIDKKPTDKTQIDFANLLINRAHGLYELADNEQLWANEP